MWNVWIDTTQSPHPYIHPSKAMLRTKSEYAVPSRAKPSAHQSPMTISRFVTSVIRIQENKTKAVACIRAIFIASVSIGSPIVGLFVCSCFFALAGSFISCQSSSVLCCCRRTKRTLSNSASSLLSHTYFTEPLCA